MPNRNLVTRVRRTPYSYTSRTTVSEAATITAYLTTIGAGRWAPRPATRKSVGIAHTTPSPATTVTSSVVAVLDVEVVVRGEDQGRVEEDQADDHEGAQDVQFRPPGPRARRCPGGGRGLRWVGHAVELRTPEG
ncbi:MULTISPECIES: hypothetical protein [Streptomyces]|uniref:hypothetical protein n=1 Tax=Streptomyces TaxID=1883 RepID=UPI00135A71B6|nr:hypothetical protein [Streptomyces sp. SLBN-115]